MTPGWRQGTPQGHIAGRPQIARFAAPCAWFRSCKTSAANVTTAWSGAWARESPRFPTVSSPGARHPDSAWLRRRPASTPSPPPAAALAPRGPRPHTASVQQAPAPLSLHRVGGGPPLPTCDLGDRCRPPPLPSHAPEPHQRMLSDHCANHSDAGPADGPAHTAYRNPRPRAQVMRQRRDTGQRQSPPAAPRQHQIAVIIHESGSRHQEIERGDGRGGRRSFWPGGGPFRSLRVSATPRR